MIAKSTGYWLSWPRVAEVGLKKGPLWRAVLLHHAEGDKLFVVVHHLAMDVVSWWPLREDLKALDWLKSIPGPRSNAVVTIAF